MARSSPGMPPSKCHIGNRTIPKSLCLWVSKGRFHTFGQRTGVGEGEAVSLISSLSRARSSPLLVFRWKGKDREVNCTGCKFQWNTFREESRNGGASCGFHSSKLLTLSLAQKCDSGCAAVYHCPLCVPRQGCFLHLNLPSSAGRVFRLPPGLMLISPYTLPEPHAVCH